MTFKQKMEAIFGASTDMTYMYEEYTLLEACIERDLEAIQTILDDNPTEEELNERDKSGRTPLSHVCSNGLLPVVDFLSDISDVDVNLPDKEGNPPIIFAAQAGHAEIVKTLINQYPKIRLDMKNRNGMTALLKAAIQGRTKCAKILLYAGANPKVRDKVRNLTPEEWARYCSRRECADEIAKFNSTKHFLFNSSKKKLRRSNSEPQLSFEKEAPPRIPTRAKSRSFRRTIKKFLPGNGTGNANSSQTNTSGNLNIGVDNPLAMVARCVSTPILPDAVSKTMNASLKRPISMDTIPTVKITSEPNVTENG